MMRRRGRWSHTMAPKPRSLIVCEGRCTEPNYFEGFRKENRNITIKVCESPGKTPSQIVRHAISMADEMDIGKVPGDSAWCVFDVDECSDHDMRKAVHVAGERLNMAISNPCFELWFILHYSYMDKRMDTCRDAVTELRRFMPGYDKSAEHYDRLRPLTATAISNAERLHKAQAGMGHEYYNRDANPCTGVHRLVSAIDSSLKRERDREVLGLE